MRQLNRLAAGTAVVAFSAFAGVGLAQADGMPGKRVAYEKPWDWGGFYFGVHSGWSWSEYSTAYTNFPTSWGVSHDAPVVGGQIGIQHQFGNIVLGVEGAMTFAYQNNWGAVDCPNPAFTCAARFNDVLTIGPRIGWAMGKWMPYITGGYASAAFDDKRVAKATNTISWEQQERFSGWYIGGGVDMALSHGWTIGLEYRHYDFGDRTYNFFTPAGVAAPLEQSISDASLDTVTVRVSWKFGRPDRVVPLK